MKWKKKYKQLLKQYLLLQQRSLEYCDKCGWNAIIPVIGSTEYSCAICSRISG